MRLEPQLIAANPRICRTISGSNIGTSVARSATSVCPWSIDPSCREGVTFSVVWGSVYVSPDKDEGPGVGGLPEPEKQPLEAVAEKNEVELFAALFRDVEEALAN